MIFDVVVYVEGILVEEDDYKTIKGIKANTGEVFDIETEIENLLEYITPSTDKLFSEIHLKDGRLVLIVLVNLC